MKRFALTTIALLALAFLFIGCEREVTGDVQVANQADENCFECHNGFLDQAQGEWQNSVHASGSNVDYTNRGGSDCTMCHNQQGFISFIETGELPNEPFDQVSAIGCFTCHDPHENGDMSLRVVGPYELANGVIFDHEDGNLCVACHHSRRSGDAITADQSVNRYWGPHHGPQGDMLEGTNGWEFPGEGYSFETSPHATVVRGACAGCHMGNVRNHDGYMVGGHTFRMVSEDGNETQVEFCKDCHSGIDEQNFIADADYDGDGVTEGYQDEVLGLLDELETLLVAQGVMADQHPTSGTIADANLAGALWNWLFVHEDQSKGSHNFDYAISLLEASIDYVSGLPPATVSGQPVTLVPAH